MAWRLGQSRRPPYLLLRALAQEAIGITFGSADAGGSSLVRAAACSHRRGAAPPHLLADSPPAAGHAQNQSFLRRPGAQLTGGD
jgi:hypothetical protein